MQFQLSLLSPEALNHCHHHQPHLTIKHLPAADNKGIGGVYKGPLSLSAI